MESRRQVRLVSLDLLRTIAIVLLVTGHIALAVGSPIGKPFGIRGFYMVGLGDVAVILFLVLSGLALELNYGQKRVHFCRFMVGRILRIYPVYWLILPIGILIYVLTSCQGASTASCLSSRGSDLLCSVFGTCAFIGRWGGLLSPLVGS
jgi:peptidoglycan/LPS O-acetylase OafA/YrhL